MCARAYLLIVFDVECHRRNALVPKRGRAGCTRQYQIWSPGRLPGGAIRCSPLVRERLGLGGWDARLRHGAMRDGLQAPGSTKTHPEASFASSGAPRCGHPLHHKSAQMVFLRGRRQWAPAHSVRRPRMGRGVGVIGKCEKNKVRINKFEKTSLGTGGWASRGVQISLRSWAYSGLLGIENPVSYTHLTLPTKA